MYSLFLSFVLLLYILPFTLPQTYQRRFGIKRIVCYLGSWSLEGREGERKFSIADIDPFICTHIIYAFADLSEDLGVISANEKIDIEQGGYDNITGLKKQNPKLKVLLGVGGSQRGAEMFSKMSADPDKRELIVRTAVSVLRKHQFDGIDLEWQFPVVRGGQASDKDNYASLVQELRKEFNKEAEYTGKERLLLTMVVPNIHEYIVAGYNVLILTRTIDFANFVAYDFPLSNETILEHHAPLEAPPGNKFNMKSNALTVAVTYLRLGMEPWRLILGIPTYGSISHQADQGQTSLGSPRQDTDPSAADFWSHSQICKQIKEENGWKIERPFPDRLGPYAYNSTTWISYDDEESVKLKAEFVSKLRLGGVMFWSLDLMDARGDCGRGTFPLVRVAREVLQIDKQEASEATTPGATSAEQTESPATRPSTSPATSTVHPPQASSTLRSVAPASPPLQLNPGHTNPTLNLPPQDQVIPLGYSNKYPFRVINSDRDVRFEDVELYIINNFPKSKN